MQQKSGFLNFLVQQKFIKIKPSTKSSLEKWSLPQFQYAFSQIQNYDNFAVIVPKGFCVIDIDSEIAGQKLFDFLKQKQINTPVIKTTRGFHFWFKAEIEKNYTKTLLPIGLYADIKTGAKNSYVILKHQNKIRKLLDKTAHTPTPLPNFLRPFSPKALAKISEKNLGEIVNLKEGSRRQALFDRLPSFALDKWKKQEIMALFSDINQYFFAAPLKKAEIEHIFSGYDLFYKNDSPAVDLDKNLENNSDNFYLKMSGTNKEIIAIANFLIKEYHIKIYNGQIYFFNGQIYIMNDSAVFPNLPGLARQKFANISQRAWKEVEFYLKTKLDLFYNGDLENYLATQNCVLVLEGQRFVKKDFSPAFFITKQIAVSFNPLADDPKVYEYLKQITLNRSNLIWGLLEFIGYSFFPKVNFDKALLLYGPTAANGKSTFLKLVQNFFGKNNYSTVPISKLSDRFEPAELADKFVNIDADIPVKFFRETESFKKIVTGDRINVQRKFEQPFSFENTAKLFFATNELPQSQEKSNGFFRRLLIVPFEANFSENPKVDVIDEITTPQAKSTLLNLCLNAYLKLLKNNRFSNYRESNFFVSRYQEKNNSFLMWLKDFLKSFYKNDWELHFKSGLFLKANPPVDLYDSYVSYCKKYHFMPLSGANFTSEMILAFPQANLKEHGAFWVLENEN